MCLFLRIQHNLKSISYVFSTPRGSTTPPASTTIESTTYRRISDALYTVFRIGEGERWESLEAYGTSSFPGGDVGLSARRATT
jgi:hypothetical protein